MIDLDQLHDFILAAKGATYIGDGEPTTSCRPARTTWLMRLGITDTSTATLAVRISSARRSFTIRTTPCGG
jgi:hypothetical protein